MNTPAEEFFAWVTLLFFVGVFVYGVGSAIREYYVMRKKKNGEASKD